MKKIMNLKYFILQMFKEVGPVFQVDAKACNARGTMPKVIHFGTL
jgi:hypothetical protein